MGFVELYGGLRIDPSTAPPGVDRDLAAAAARGDPTDADGARWQRVPRAEVLGFVQPAFAARSLALSPVDLDARWLPQGATAGVSALVVPVEPRALPRAEFAASRLKELVLRFAPRVVLAVADPGGGRPAARAFPDAPDLGAVAAAFAAWSRAHGLLEKPAILSVDGLRVKVRADHDGIEVGSEGKVIRHGTFGQA